MRKNSCSFSTEILYTPLRKRDWVGCHAGLRRSCR